MIRWEVRTRIEAGEHFSNSVLNRTVFCLWGISSSVLNSLATCSCLGCDSSIFFWWGEGGGGGDDKGC